MLTIRHVLLIISTALAFILIENQDGLAICFIMISLFLAIGIYLEEK